MKYFVDAALCSGHGQCYATAPEVFNANANGENSAIGRSVSLPAELEVSARRGARSCPESAIRILNDTDQ
jgi:ferredoxin